MQKRRGDYVCRERLMNWQEIKRKKKIQINKSTNPLAQQFKPNTSTLI